MSTIRLRDFTNAAVVAALAVAITGCPRKKTEAADAAAEASVGVVDAAPEVLASNEADITRLPDETKVENVIASTEANVTTVRKAPGTGAILTTLPKATNVTELAQKDKF